MNKFVKSDYDRFKQKKVVELKDEIQLNTSNTTMMLLEPKVGFRQISIEDQPSVLVIDFTATSRNGLNLSNGELLMILDGKHLSFKPNESFSDPYLDSFHIESNWYEISKDDLKAICDATSFEVRVTNGNDYADLSSLEKMQWGARVMYNALFDKTAYANAILKPGNLRDQQAFVEKHKSRLTWTWVLGILAIIIGYFWAWWLIVIGIGAIGIYQYCYTKKKNDIINSTELE